MMNFDQHFRAAVTVDNVIFGFDKEGLKVLLIKRGEAPFLDQWALPGYFMQEEEDLDTAAGRVLNELTGLQDVYLEQVNSFGKIDRHPQGRVITVAYYSLIKITAYELHATSDVAKLAKWVKLSDAKELAFDHYEILVACFRRLKRRVRMEPVGFELLPRKFTLTELQHLYEAILETELDKRNFRKKIISMKLLVDLGETQKAVAHRPAKLYKFDRTKYNELKAKGFNFEL